MDDVGHHAEEIAVVDLPYLLHQQIPDPAAVLGFLQFSVAHDPLFVGLNAGILQVHAPLADQSLDVPFVDLFLTFFGGEFL